MDEIVGIDLGTTNSLIGVVEAGFPILLADETGARLTPSAVYFPPDGEPEAGSAALRRKVVQPERVVTSVKRLIGRRPGEMDHAPAYETVSDARGGVSVQLGGRVLSPVEISAIILRRLKAVAERALERSVTRAVITVPAYFNDAQRTATRQAGELAGFAVERILNEPTAAALAFGLDKLGERSRVAVFDLGGGTFDISILEMNEGIFQVLATHGDTALGGDDIDRAFAAWLAEQVMAVPASGVEELGPQRISSAPQVVRIPDMIVPRDAKGMVAGMRAWVKTVKAAIAARMPALRLDWGKLVSVKSGENPLHHFQALAVLPELYAESRLALRAPDAAGLAGLMYERRYGWALFPDGKRRHVLLTCRLYYGPQAPPKLYALEALEIHEADFAYLPALAHDAMSGLDQSAAAALLPQFLAGFKPEHRFPSSGGAWTAEARARLHAAAVEAKHALSAQESVEIRLPFLRGAENFVRTVTRAEFETMARPILERTRGHCLQALSDARLKASDLNAVVLVGGSTRIPLVRRLAEEIFGRAPDTSQHPDETVALGAVIQAGILSGAMRKMVLLDVTPLSLGIETFGGLMNVILPRNTTIPAKAGEMFTNAVSGQREMLIRVLQGEREMARDNWELGQFGIEFEPVPKGQARVGVQFHIDADGILQVLARDTKTNTDRVLEIRAAVDVADEKVEQMISASVEHAFDDMHERQWVAAKQKADELLAALAAALPAAGEALDPAARAGIQSAEAEVRAALASENLPALKAASAKLDAATESLAAILVEQAMEASLQRRGLV